MVSIDDMKDLTLYKRPFFLPIDPKDKRHNSEVMLLTPNYQSSINCMKAPYIINRNYFESYYLEKNVLRYISSKGTFEDPVNENYIFEATLSSSERKELPDSAFGLPSQRRYPMPDKEHVLLAIKFFNHVEEEYEEELATNIIAKIKEFDMKDEVNVGEKNRFYPYWKSSNVYHESSLPILEDYTDDTDFDYYFSKDIVKKFNNTVNMADVDDEAIHEGKLEIRRSASVIVIDKKGALLVMLNNDGILTIPRFALSGDDQTGIDTIKYNMKGLFDVYVTDMKELYKFTYSDRLLDDKDIIVTETTYMIRYDGTISNRTPANYKWVKFMTAGHIIDAKYPKSKSLLRYISQYGFETMYTSISYTEKRLGNSNNIIYQGYDTDVAIVSKLIDRNYLSDVFKDCSLKYPGSVPITIIVSRNPDDFGYIDDMNLTVLSKSAFEKRFDYLYEEYLAFICFVFAYHTINPNVSDNIVYPLSMYKCGIVDSELDDRKYRDKYEVERVFRYIDETYGYREIHRIVKYNDYKSLIRYAREYAAVYLKESSLKEQVSYVSEIETLFENEEEKKTEIPSLEDIGDLGKKITRKIKNATIYKLNKIRRDIERGNTGAETKGTTTTLDRIRNNDVVSLPTPATESASIDWLWLDENAIIDENIVYFLEDVNYDAKLKDALYQDRIKNNKQIITIYKKVKADCPFIKYAYTEVSRYNERNVFFDLSYYNESYFKNVVANQEKMNSTINLKVYRELLKRLISDNRFSRYKKKTIFIPVLDWRHNKSTRMWMYKEDLNPISIIYDLIRNNSSELKSLFGDMDVIFLGGKNYFKVNFSDAEWNNVNIQKFINLIKRLVTLGYNSPADPDPEDEPMNTASGIAMDIIDKVEKSQNITIKNVEPALKAKTDIKIYNPDLDNTTKPEVVGIDSTDAVKKVNAKKTLSTPDVEVSKQKETRDLYSAKGSKADSKTVTITTKKYSVDTTPDDKIKATKIDKPSVNNAVNAVDKEKDKDNLVKAIAKAAEGSSTSDEAMSKLDTDEFKELLDILNAEAEENVRVNKARASRIAQLSEEFKDKNVNGKSVKDLLKENPNDKKLPETKLPVASINDDWNHMTFMNFDKLYDPDSDIVKMLDNMKNWSYPISVRNIEVVDNSTSEDLLNLWTIDCEDFKGTRFKLKIDIPKFINDKFLLLRGNKKTLMIQSTLAPIIKTDLDTCQIIGIGGYNKIFVRRYGTNTGKSTHIVNKFIKALNKMKSDKIKIVYGDNTKICGKYELPIDYIDLAGYYNTIETPQYKLYFNQDELRKDYVVDDSKGIPIGIEKNAVTGKDQRNDVVLYYSPFIAKEFKTLGYYIRTLIGAEFNEFEEIYRSINNTGIKYTYSKASILSEKIPLVLVCAYVEGLTSVMKKAGIEFSFKTKLEPYDRQSDTVDYIPFADGYLIYEMNYSSSLLMNGLKEFDTMGHSLKEINSKKMYMEFLSEFGALKTDGLENSYDCMIDPITKEILEIYKLPTDYVSVLLHANNLLADNKFVKHTDMSVRRFRRKELIAGYFYKALSTAYQSYANQIRHSRRSVKMAIKQSAVIDMILSKDPSTNDLSINNVINDVECANTVTNKGLVGMNNDRAYSLDKRGYDESMMNIMAMSTGFSANVGVNRQATINCNIEGARGFVKTIDGDSTKLSAANSLCISEAITPFGSTHDDPFRTLMTYVQTSKHQVRCEHNDPLLVTNGADEAMAYLSSDIFAFKAKKNGVVKEIVTDPNSKTSVNNYMVIEYEDGTNEFINLAENVEKNSDGGYYVPLKLDTDLKVGQKVKAGSVVAYDKKSFSSSLGESGNLALNVGTLAKVAILNTDEGYEDSAACTEEFTRKLGTEVIVAKEVVVDKNSNVFLQKKIGEHVNQGDVLLSYQAAFDDETANQLMKNLSIDADKISELGRNPVKSKYTGILEDIRIYRTVDLDELSPSLQKLVKMYETPIKNKKKIMEQYGVETNTLPPTKKLDHTGKTKNVYDGVLIVFYIKYLDTMAIGDKIVFYSANKGIIKYIIPEGQEPYTSFRPKEHIDAFVAASSINGRMVCSTTVYGSIAKLMVELDRSCKDLAGIPYDESQL